MTDLHELQANVDRARKRVRDLALQGDYSVSEFMHAAKEELVQINVAKFLLENQQAKY